MKKATFLQIMIILIIILIWNGLHLSHNYLEERYERELSSQPMILVCSDYLPLNNLKTYLDTINIILRTQIESDTLIKKNLIETYQLSQAETLLSSFNVPSVMKIYFRGSGFSFEKKRELEVLLNTSYPEVIANYDHDFWQVNSRKIELLQKSYLFTNIFLAVFLFFTIILLRLHFESKRHEYWQIYRSAGGSRKMRSRQFFLHSVFICLLPVGLNLAAYFAAVRFNYLFIRMDVRLFAAEFVLITIAVIFSRIFMGKKF